MAKRLASLRNSESKDPPVFLIYGNDGVGKTSLAAEFPTRSICTSRAKSTPKGINLPSEKIASYNDLCRNARRIVGRRSRFPNRSSSTPIDGLEPLVWEKTCKRIGAATIEAAGYRQGIQGSRYRMECIYWMAFAR
jgi:hypothetical protein